MGGTQRLEPAAFGRMARTFRALAWSAVGLTLVLFVVGGLVTSYEVGMSVPDASTTLGDPLVLAPQDGLTPGQRVEHSHRLTGMVVGIVTLGLAIVGLWGAALRRLSRFVGLASGVALSMVVIQGLLGMWRVAADSTTWAMVHAGFAQLTFALLAGIAVASCARWQTLRAAPSGDGTDAPPVRWAIAAVVLVYVQIVLGILTRHLGPIGGGHAANTHLLNAFLVTIVVGALAMRAVAIPAMRILGGTLLTLLVIQLGLGMGAWGAAYTTDTAAAQTAFAVGLATAHVAAGAAMLGMTVAAAMIARRLAGTVPVSRPDGPAPVSYVPEGQKARVLA